MENNFYRHLIKTLFESLKNHYNDNYDYIRFGKKRQRNYKSYAIKYLKSKNYYKFNLKAFSGNIDYDSIFTLLDEFNVTYDLLQNEPSKELLVKLLVYRILGNEHVKLIDTTKLWTQFEETYNYADKNDFINIKLNNWKLNKCDLSHYGFNLKLYTMPPAIIIQFVLKQYEYKINENNFVKVENNDVVIDCGGCFGETACFFANELSENGKVFSFEFIPSNIAIFKKNIELNPSLTGKIEIVPNPVWSESNKVLYYKDNGPGSFVNEKPFEGNEGEVKTLSIDDLVRNKNLDKVDFIKMDIEGAELSALKGAEKTMITYKPKLAISVYHKKDDLITIPNYLNNLNLGYKFYLGHYTSHLEETVLYATIEN
jgi:FkbM family methyltransferase